ncbi:DNA for glycosyltransferase [Lachnospiraceae bacterium KM106-2]|nr:DNA for glycosyltransferase [Lachnospiraceae bacterium KM106-2]
MIEDSLFWILISFVLVVISIFPQIPAMMTKLVGIGEPVNFVFLSMIFILLLKVFLMSIRISQLEDRLRTLTQNISIKDHLVEKNIKSIEEELK